MVMKVRKPIDSKITAITNMVGTEQLLWLLLLSCAYILRDIAKLQLPDILFTGLCGLAFLFSSTGSAMGIYIFTTALTVPDFEIRVVYIAVLFCKFIWQRRKINIVVLILTIGLILLELTNMTMFSDQAFADVIYTVAMRLTYFVLPLFWFNESCSKEDYQRALLCYVAGVILGGAVLLYMSVDSVGWTELLTGSGIRLGMNTTNDYDTINQMHTAYNANQLGMMLVIGATIVLVLMDHRHISKLWGVVLSAFSVFLVFLTKSRTAVFLGASVVVIYCIVLLVRKKKLLSAAFIMAGAMLLIYAIISLFPDVADDLMSRFDNESYQSDNRGELFMRYIDAWQGNNWALLFGYGIGSYDEVLHLFGSPHNAIADILISWGVTGLVVIVSLLVLVYRHGIRNVSKKERLLILLPALVALAGAMTGQYLTIGYPHMRMCFLLLATQALSTSSEERLPIKGA